MLSADHTRWVELSGEAAQVAMTETGGNIVEINLAVNPILGEIRQQRLALRQLLAQLKLGSAEANTTEDDPIARMMAEFSSDH